MKGKGKSNMRNVLISCIGCLSLLLTATDAKAANTTAAITNIQVLNASPTGTAHVVILWMGILGNPPDRAGCHNGNQGSAWAIDLSTNKGRAMLSVATAALLAGKQISITGFTGTGAEKCIATGTVGNIEGISNLTLSS
jgi:hypothetical protein